MKTLGSMDTNTLCLKSSSFGVALYKVADSTRVAGGAGVNSRSAKTLLISYFNKAV